MIKLILFVTVFSAPLFGQLTGNAQLVLFPGAPSGNCTSRQLALNQSSGSLYACINSAWQVTAGAGAVSSVFGRTGAIAAQTGDFNVSQVTGAAALASPALTGVPTGPTATPGTNTTQLATTAFVLANSATGGSALQGCATATAGVLVCDLSVQGGTGTVGMLTMPYAAGGLPNPPAGNHAAIAPDSGGHLFWSPGNNTPFVAIGSGGGGGTPTPVVDSFNGRTGAVMPQASDYAAFFAPIGSTGGGGGTATGLQFGTVTLSTFDQPPAQGECLSVDQNTIRGTSCGGNLGGVLIVN